MHCLFIIVFLLPRKLQGMYKQSSLLTYCCGFCTAHTFWCLKRYLGQHQARFLSPVVRILQYFCLKCSVPFTTSPTDTLDKNGRKNRVFGFFYTFLWYSEKKGRRKFVSGQFSHSDHFPMSCFMHLRWHKCWLLEPALLAAGKDTRSADQIRGVVPSMLHTIYSPMELLSWIQSPLGFVLHFQGL